jgi:lactate dehydrogenase-like 2-hydroxyacid dehydrogenase
MDKDKIAIIGTGEAGAEVARKIAEMDMKPLVMDKPAPAQTKEEELKKVDPKLIEAFDKLSEADKISLQRGYKTWKTNGKCEYVLVDNFPFDFKQTRGSNFTPKKKKRKK